MAGLEARLQAELKRLGKDTAKTVSQAPKGAGGAVFDLHGTVIDPDGPPDGQGGGTQPPTGIQFTWTERLVGDYDMNGLVGLPDLVPISSKWHARPAYESPALHGGFASWPTGDPDDSSGSAAGPGATNWRVARVDGDGNGLIALPDIVPIAAHWQESLSGYRVYRKAPGESTFAMVADPDDASSPLTIRRSKWFPPGKDGPDQSRPVRYGLTIPAPEGGFTTGVYQFYVAAYDEASSTMGEPSATLSVELPANTVNLSPVAHLSLSPDFAGAPAVITLSASQSYDADGSIAEYRWDLDDDGTIDYSTSDPAPPAQSSGGTVKEITPGPPPAPGQPPPTLTATYAQGSAQWLHPRLVVLDNKGAAAAASATLGVSGWALEMMESPSETNVGNSFTGSAMSVDPNTGEVVLVGWPADYGSQSEYVRGYYFWRRMGVKQWTHELIVDYADPAWLGTWQDAVVEGDAKFFWDSQGRPVVLASVSNGNTWAPTVKLRALTSDTTGHWKWEDLGTNMGTGDGDPDEYAPGRAVSLVEGIESYSTPGGGTASILTQVMWFQNGEWVLDHTNWHTSDHKAWWQVAVDGSGTAYMLSMREVGYAADPFSITWARRLGPDDWVEERVDNGELAGPGAGIRPFGFGFGPDGRPVFAVLRQYGENPNDTYSLSMVRQTPGGLVETALHDSVSPMTGDTRMGTFDGGFGIFSRDPMRQHNEAPVSMYYDRFEGSTQLHETIFTHDATLYTKLTDADYLATVTTDGGDAYVIVNSYGGEWGSHDHADLLATRVDPRY